MANAFWNSPNMEPMRQFRWYITFGSGLDGSKYALKKCDKPKVKVNSVQHKYINHFFNFPGRVEWEDINITFAAINDPNTSKELYRTLTAAGYQFPESDTDRTTISKANFVGQLGAESINLIQIDAAGIAQETWKIINPFFTSVQFGTLDYSSEEIVEITCTLKYDSASLK